MKLAEALVLRADYQKRLEQLKFRLIRSAKVQEGDEPAENPSRLLDELEDVATRLAELIRRIKPYELGCYAAEWRNVDRRACDS